jgi:hypothetical protein
MTNVTAPPPGSLPPTPRLNRSAMIALVVALVLVTVAVLPAERRIDPTGIGQLLGLTQVGEFKVAVAKETADEERAEAEARAADSVAALTAAVPAPVATDSTRPAGREDVTTLTLGPGGTREIKLVMKKGARVSYSWATNSGVVNHETHGDTINARPGDFHSYKKGVGKQSDEGEIVAVFDGLHGWFWRNRGSRAVTVTLRTKGDYSQLRELK